MFVLVGGIEHSAAPESRRRLLKPPRPASGFMASAGRSLADVYVKLKRGELDDHEGERVDRQGRVVDESLPHANQGCAFLKEVINTTIARAEKAAALLPTTAAATVSGPDPSKAAPSSSPPLLSSTSEPTRELLEVPPVL
eukprot:GHVU01134287.1.p1 GENE.GHVU01134287.1~~GHVU01134287.1.p1  ORF type:complete len:140 (+),score=29.47 GHVU01134287.1:278-697(+)